LVLSPGAPQITISQSVCIVFRCYAVRYRELARLNMAEITEAIRGWAAQHPIGTAEEAVTDLELPYPRDMVFIVRSVLFRVRESSARGGETA
jgi:hypothetical protein